MYVYRNGLEIGRAPVTGLETARISGTYVYSADTKAWVKTDGSTLNPASIFFPIESRGGLFYFSQVESMTQDGTDQIDGATVKKVKIKPTSKVIQDFLGERRVMVRDVQQAQRRPMRVATESWEHRPDRLR